MDKSTEQAVNDYRDALLTITEAAQDSIDPHVAIVTGIQFFATMAFDMAPNEEIANKAISTGINFALEDSREEG